jgi:predicted RNA-binding protein with PUA-like domain
MISMETRVWFFQSNPAHYDIDAALSVLDRIWWRVPQYTNEIHTGHVAVLWRSGKKAGIVGIGRVIADPQQHPADAAEKPFVITDEEGAEDTTRALIRLQAVPFLSKDQIRAIPEFRQHQMVVAPMGTVFPISSGEWSALEELLPRPPEVAEGAGSALPPGFAWSQRAKGVLQMPGGYSGYLASLRKVCALVADERPTPV